MDFRSGLKRSVSDPGVQSENSQKSKKSNLNLIHAVPSDKVLNSNIPPDICNHDVKLVNKKFSVNGTHQTVVEMKESTKLFQRHNSIGLWEDFSRNGYILLRGVLDRDAILQANLDIRKRLVKMCLVDQSDSLTALSSSGYTVEMASGFLVCKGLGGNPSPEDHARQGAWRDLCHSSTVQSILNNEIVDIILLLLADGKSQCEDPGYQVRKFGQEKAWLRVKAAHEFTPEHADIYHFRKCTELYVEPNPATTTIVKADNVATANNSLSSSSSCLEGTVYKRINVGTNNSAKATDPTTFIATKEVLCLSCKEVCIYKKVRNTSMNGVLCQECGHAYHFHCLEPHSSEDRRKLKQRSRVSDWYCVECNPRHVLGTTWIPLDDLDNRSGVLAMLSGSQNLAGMDKSNSLRGGNELPDSYFSQGRRLVWHTAAFHAGDLVLFDSHMIHGTSKNYNGHYRLSVDSRWYLSPAERSNVNVTPHGKLIQQLTTLVPDPNDFVA